MAEVGRIAVRDPGALLPGGFWAAAAVWLERPQVANKRLCGVRLEGRRRAVLPRAESRGRPEQEGRAASGRGPEDGPGAGQRAPDGGPGLERPRADEGQPPLAGPPGRPGEAAGGEADLPAADLESLWDGLCRSLVRDRRDLLAFLTGPGPGAPRELHVLLRTVVPKRSARGPPSAPKREIVVQDVLNGTVTFLPLEEDDTGNLKVKMSNVYQIQLSLVKEEWFMSVLIFCPERWHSDGIVYPKVTWLAGELLAKLARWSVESRQSTFKSTLSLISIVKYSKAYQELKEKYKDMVKVWPEVTDPEKFVYEDVAIAAYLLVLWEDERAERGVTAKQSFVDLGCGNGLLVHVLSSEGHPGRGIDIRRRKIWDMYGPQTRLEVGFCCPSCCWRDCSGPSATSRTVPEVGSGNENKRHQQCFKEDAITPNDSTLFPDVDWLIGNHSDELTPWIPVIAARYHRRQSEKTQYRGYLDFITEVGVTCGFHVEEDCLRIPSTKRVCLIGKSRTYPPSGEASMDVQRTQYIHRRRGCPGSPPSRAAAPPSLGATASSVDRPDGCPGSQGAPDVPAEEPWLPAFRPREKTERIRNCATLPRDVVDQVVLQVADLLLGGQLLNPRSAPGGRLKAWNRGESLSLSEVADKLDKETLRRLKRECGGLQTLLRNSHQVFEVLNGSVHIRDWREEKRQEGKHPEAKRTLLSGTFKTRLCWFFTHHPDGCVLPSHCCPFAHGPEELRPPRRKHRSCELPPPCEGPVERQAPAPQGCMVSETFPCSSPLPSMGTEPCT